MYSFWETMSRSAHFRENLMTTSPVVILSESSGRSPPIDETVEDEVSSITSAVRSPGHSSVDKSELSELSERLKLLETLEKIDEIERRRSLRLTQLSTPDSSEFKDVLDEMARSTRLIANSQMKAAEKDTNENVKLKSLDTEDLIKFLAGFNRRSCQPVYRQIPVDLHKGLIISLGLPAGSTLESFYGVTLGEDTLFVRDIRRLVSSRTDIKPKQVLQSHCMSDRSILDRTSLMNMLAMCQEVVNSHTALFGDFSLAEWKEAVISNIRPLFFRSLVLEYHSRYINSSFTFENLVQLIVKEFDDESFSLNRIKARGVEGLANNVIVSANLKSEAEAERNASYLF